MGRINKEELDNQQEVTINLPTWLIEAVDKEAKRRDVSRETLIRVWLVDRLVAPRRPDV